MLHLSLMEYQSDSWVMDTVMLIENGLFDIAEERIDACLKTNHSSGPVMASALQSLCSSLLHLTC